MVEPLARVGLTSVACLLLGMRWVRAYIDPGSGSFAIQVLLAVALGSLLSVRLWWGRFVSIFRRRNSDPDADTDESGADESGSLAGATGKPDERKAG